MTVNVYGHLVPGVNRAAMDRLPTLEDPVEKAAKTDHPPAQTRSRHRNRSLPGIGSFPQQKASKPVALHLNLVLGKVNDRRGIAFLSGEEENPVPQA